MLNARRLAFNMALRGLSKVWHYKALLVWYLLSYEYRGQILFSISPRQKVNVKSKNEINGFGF